VTPLDFIPISEAVARVVGRVMRRQRERQEFNDADLAAKFPVADPEDAEMAREFAEPEIGA
jgi:hypothetical protein